MYNLRIFSAVAFRIGTREDRESVTETEYRQLTGIGHLALVVRRKVHVLRVRRLPVHIHSCRADFITTYIHRTRRRGKVMVSSER